ncbi:MAG: MurT ligase domain-containing protein [Candidatus Gastranaerophilales bacterium]|nr:MurT ligase domain-containing protein [Candidatus Gastranaerophilales bacterium]
MNKDIIAVNAAKLTSLILKVLHFGAATSMPGIIASSISPKILSRLVNQTKKEIIAITGTNGKTTSANFLSAILQKDNRRVAHNKKGANMLTGVTAAVVECADIKARLNADNCILECDEAYLQKFADYFLADYLIVTNLFRDQLDRYGELDTTAKMIKKAVDKFQKNDKFTTVLNADDPTILSLAGANSIYFGFDDIEYEKPDENISANAEAATCKCGKDIKYTKIYYGHIGHYYCDCGLARPKTFVSAKAKILVDHSIIKIYSEEYGYDFEVSVNLPGVYNAYNALSAIVLSLKLGIKPEIISQAFENYQTVFGRAEKRIINGKNVLVQLIKNPAGTSEVLRTVKDDPKSKILIIINDDYADGRDVSWLWDANFELINSNQKQIITSGIRYADMAVRLKYAGIPAENIVMKSNIKQAIDYALKETMPDEKLYILPTYTALLKMQKILK